MPPDYMPDAKVELRRAAIAGRRKVHAERAGTAAVAVAGFVQHEIAPREKTIAGYWPIGDELDVRPSLEAVIAGGGRAALPVVAGQGQVLIFRVWSPATDLETGPFGTSHPTVRAAIVVPDVLLLPVVAFDQTGQRLGYGAGYYDRTLGALRAQRPVAAIGIAYDEQEIAAVPTGPNDERLDAVFTDRRVLWLDSVVRTRLKQGTTGP